MPLNPCRYICTCTTCGGLAFCLYNEQHERTNHLLGCTNTHTPRAAA